MKGFLRQFGLCVRTDRSINVAFEINSDLRDSQGFFLLVRNMGFSLSEFFWVSVTFRVRRSVMLPAQKFSLFLSAKKSLQA